MRNFSEVRAMMTDENLPEARLVVTKEVNHLRQMLTMLKKHDPDSIYGKQVDACKKRISEREQWLRCHPE